MILHLLGAVLMAGAVIYTLSTPGRLSLIRHLRHGAQLCTVALAIALLLLAAHVLALLDHLPSLLDQAIIALTLLAVVAATGFLLRTLTAPPRPVEAAGTARRVLVIGAHPDDLELACGGTVAKLVDSGYEVHALVMSHGQQGGNRAQRPSEAQAGGALLGLAEVEVLDLPDTALADSSQEMVEQIEARLRDLTPELLLTHSVHDLHQDHHAVHLATLRAGRRHPSILCFESPSTTRDFDPSVFVDISHYIDIKVEGIRRHRDQRGKPYMGARTVRGAAAFRGGQSRTGFAEAFEPVRLLAGALSIFDEPRGAGGAEPAPAPVPASLSATSSLDTWVTPRRSSRIAPANPALASARVAEQLASHRGPLPSRAPRSASPSQQESLA